MWNGYEAFKKYEVKAESVEDFLNRFTKHDRHHGRGEEYAQHRLNSYTEEFNKLSYTFMISFYRSLMALFVYPQSTISHIDRLCST